MIDQTISAPKLSLTFGLPASAVDRKYESDRILLASNNNLGHRRIDLRHETTLHSLTLVPYQA